MDGSAERDQDISLRTHGCTHALTKEVSKAKMHFNFVQESKITSATSIMSNISTSRQDSL